MTKAPATGLGKLHVLVVDDHKGMRQIIWTILTGLGVGQITEAADAATALFKMRDFRFDIIFIDWMLPGIDGLRLVRHIRRLPDAQNPFVPIILVTGHAEYDRVLEARNAGVNEFLVKPLNTLSVAQRLETIIKHPRPFVRTGTYVGPDRRRQTREFNGPDRRTPAEAVLVQSDINPVVKGGSDEQ